MKSSQAHHHRVRPKVTVLLVDDDPDCRALVRDAILRTGLPVRIRGAAGGQEALDYLRRSPPGLRPGLIYLDIEMPGLSGQEVLQAIKSDESLADIPVVMLTGLDDEEQVRQATSHGANSYTIKPMDPATFMQFMRDATRYWLEANRAPLPMMGG